MWPRATSKEAKSSTPNRHGRMASGPRGRGQHTSCLGPSSGSFSPLRSPETWHGGWQAGLWVRTGWSSGGESSPHTSPHL